MRVLFVGDLAATGFGSVTADLGSELLNLGVDVRFVSQNDTGNQLPEPFLSRTLSLPSLITVVNSMTGEAGMVDAALLGSLFHQVSQSELTNGEAWGTWQPDACIVLGDILAARAIVSRTPDFGKVPTLHYVPIEGVSLPKTLKYDLWATVTPVAMSEFGADEIEKVVGERPPVVYHGVDSSVFHPIKPSRPVVLQPNPDMKPLTVSTRDQCKAMWAAYFHSKFPAHQQNGKLVHSDKWMLRTDRHMPRKGYNGMLRALVPVLGKNPDALLIIHCATQDQGGNLGDTLSKLPGSKYLTGDAQGGPETWSLFERPYAQIMLTNAIGLDRGSLVTLYNTADLYLSTSAEGFGLTIAEALACGVPAVGLDYSAVPEVIGPAGRLVPPAYLYDNPYDHFWAAVDEDQFGETVHALLNDKDGREAFGRKGPRHVTKTFRWDTAARQFADLLEARIPLEAVA